MATTAIPNTWRHPATGATFRLTEDRRLEHWREGERPTVAREYVSDPVVEGVLIRSAGYEVVYA